MIYVCILKYMCVCMYMYLYIIYNGSSKKNLSGLTSILTPIKVRGFNYTLGMWI